MTCTHNQCFEQNNSKYSNFSNEFIISFSNEKSLYVAWTSFHNECTFSVPLKSINVDIKIIGFVAEVTSSLQYTNSEDKPVEAEFTFPVDDGSAVFKFEAEIEGRHIVAEIQEKEQVGYVFL